jgi:hypothetical protein
MKFAIVICVLAAASAANWEDISVTCPAGDSDITSCEFPQISASNTVGDDLTTKMNVVVVRFEGATPIHVYEGKVGQGTDAAIVASEGFDWNKPGYYMFNYTASDGKYGNNAEDFIFALFLDDLTAPVVTPLNDESTHYEACSPMCPSAQCKHTNFPGFSAKDNINGDVSKTLKFSFNGEGDVDADTADTLFNTAQTKCFAGGKTLAVSASAHDSAGAFGQGGANNVGHASTTYDISDTIAPAINVNENAKGTVECCKRDYTDYNPRGDGHAFASCIPYAYKDAGATSNDAVDCNNIPVQKIDSKVDISQKGTYQVTYTAIDTCDNSASLTRS